MMDPDKQNPGWKRPADWPFEEDWDSPAWQQRMRQVRDQTAKKREEYGFSQCPKCGTQHTGRTLSCRNCSYRAAKPQ